MTDPTETTFEREIGIVRPVNGYIRALIAEVKRLRTDLERLKKIEARHKRANATDFRWGDTWP